MSRVVGLSLCMWLQHTRAGRHSTTNCKLEVSCHSHWTVDENARWAPELVRMFWEKKLKLLPLPGIELGFLDCPAPSIATINTVLYLKSQKLNSFYILYKTHLSVTWHITHKEQKWAIVVLPCICISNKQTQRSITYVKLQTMQLKKYMYSTMEHSSKSSYIPVGENYKLYYSEQ
jgi:hypothetical protein